MKKVFLFLLSIAAAISVLETKAQGTMWGVTQSGGTSGGGTLFKANFDGTGFLKVRDFNLDVPGNNPISRLATGPDGKLYGYATLGGGTFDNGLIFQYDPATNAYAKVFDFNLGISGANPKGALLLYGTKFYGVATNGGSNGSGTLFEFDPATSTFTKKADFQSASTGATPSGYLTLYNDKFYGTTSIGGGNNKGTLFEFDPSAAVGANLVNKYDFNGTDGEAPLGELTVSGSLIYGTASVGGANDVGVLFEFNPAAAVGSNYAKKVDFDAATFGATPRNGLALVSGTMYGTTSAGGASSVGTIYAYVPGVTSISKMIDLTNNDGSNGNGTLLYANNLLYGNTPNYMFTYDPTQQAGSGFTEAFDYDYFNTGQDIQGGFMLGPSGKIYGLAWSAGLAQAGAIFEYDPALPIDHSNINPRGRIYFHTSSGTFQPTQLIYLNGKFYGHSPLGDENRGTIFEYDPANSSFIDTGFDNFPQSSFPSIPVEANGKLYGAINSTVYEYDPTAHTITNKTVNVGFGVQGFTLAANGLLYGISSSLGANNKGFIVEYDPIGNTSTKKLDFESTYNGNAVSTFSLASNGLLYAVFQNGGANNKGYLIEYTPGSSTVSKKFEFQTGKNFYNSWELITSTANGKLYCIRTYGGTNGTGSILEYTLPTLAAPDGVVKEVYSFSSSGTGLPWGGLVESGNGKLYGSTLQGGSNGQGIFFEYDPIQNSYSEKSSFVPINGFNQGGLLVIPDPQTITFDALTPAHIGSVLKPATASSGLPIQYTSSNTSVAIAKGDSIIAVGVGTTTITASQSGNGGYLAATPVQQTLTVKVITGIEPGANAIVKIYPNPVHQMLTIENESGEIAPVIIRSSLGEIIYQNEQSMKHEVNVLPWVGGLYIVEVRRGNAITQTKVIKY